MSWDRIDRYRVRTGQTLAEVAQKVGVGVSMLMMVKSGKRGLSKKALYRLGLAEQEAGISYEPPTVPSRLVKDKTGQYRIHTELKGVISDLDNLQDRVDREIDAVRKRVDDVLKRIK